MQDNTKLKKKQRLNYRNYKRYQRTLKTCERLKKVISSLSKNRFRLETKHKKMIELLENEKVTLKEDQTITQNYLLIGSLFYFCYYLFDIFLYLLDFFVS